MFNWPLGAAMSFVMLLVALGGHLVCSAALIALVVPRYERRVPTSSGAIVGLSRSSSSCCRRSCSWCSSPSRRAALTNFPIESLSLRWWEEMLDTRISGRPSATA